MSARNPSGDRPLALVDGRAVRSAQLDDLVYETAGGLILEEVILDRALRRRLQDRGLELTERDLDDEQRILLDTLSSNLDEAVRLLEELRRRRDLGSARFDMLLRRNAMLRALVRDAVELTETDVEAEYALRYGPRYQVRLFTGVDRQSTREAWDRVQSGEPFGDVAVESSTDTSAARGGLLEPLSPIDPRYPAAIRQILADLQPGEASAILPIENGFAFVELARVIPADDTPLAQVRGELEQAARLSRERFLMDGLVREILGEVDVVVLQPSLARSWNRRRDGEL
ncbi:MAG: peptidylprolyl isomerase [Phycisphaerales bacterium]